MRNTRRRAIAALMALALFMTLGSSSVDALTVRRTWIARLPAGAANGTIIVRSYLGGTGSIQYGLKGLVANATYGVEVRPGTCARLGAVALRLPAVRTSSVGAVATTAAIPAGDMSWFWSAARTPSFVTRIVSGTSIRCGSFAFAQATRIAIPTLGIDLPIIRGPSGYPYCRVAMYVPQVAQPREPGITFLYAHARTGMFLPLLSRWRTSRGASLIGRTVKVWTSDSRVSYYRIVRVRVTSTPMAGVTSLRQERLWLQTSTGPNTRYPKLIVEAVRYATLRTTYAASHPAAHPVTC